MNYLDPSECLHLHILCMDCDMSGGHCHCMDMGTWFCQDCNKGEFEVKSKDLSVTFDEAREARTDTSYRYSDHERRFVEIKTI